MKLSFYNILVNDYPKSGEYLVYNTRTQALVKIDLDFRRFLESLGKNNTVVPPERKADLEKLYQMGIVVRDAADEQRKLDDFFSQMKFGVDRSLFIATVLTTYDCNFNCTYCFEKHARQKARMDIATSDFTILWLQQRIEELQYREFFLNFYGGEPLLNLEIIEYIAGRMREWCEQQEVKFSFGLQTNGYLLTADVVERLKPFGLKAARVSVDGVAVDHDRFRTLINGQGTFDRVMKNIQANIDDLTIDIAVGCEAGDTMAFEKLLTYFEEQGILNKIGQIIVSPIHPGLGPADDPKAIRRPECLDNFSDDRMVATTTRVNALLRAKGLSVRNRMAVSICSLTRENGAVTIDPNGLLYRCNSFLGHPDFSLGDVRRRGFNQKQKCFRDLDVWRQCPAQCPYLPMCNGGCRMISFLECKNFTIPSCKREYLDRVAPDLIKMEYEDSLAKIKNARYNKTLSS